MKRIVCVGILSFAVLAGGWSLAQPPATDVEEPPVRLKKKKRDEPAKVEPEPQPPDRPEEKPDAKPPRKPKLDEDLDPRDDVNQPKEEDAEGSEIIRRLVRNTRLSEEKLGKRELGEKTRQLQKDIVVDIDRLIQQSKQDQQQSSSSSSESSPSAGPSKEDPSQRRQARQRERQGRRGSQSAQRTPRDQQGQQGNSDNPKGGGDSQARGNPSDPEKKFDLWGHLPEKERALMNKEMEQRFMEKYDELTKQYYRTIAEKSRKKE